MTEIIIVEPQSDWQEEFKNIAMHIRSIVGSGVIRIDHIGSTSVPGLAAKDVIDIQLTVSDLENDEDILKLQKNGYEHIGRITGDSLVGLEKSSVELRKIFFCERPGDRRANIHIREQGRVNQLYPLLFRDYLRSDSVVRDAYAEVKKELAKRFSDDEDAYYDIKDPYMDTVYQAAKLWSQLCNWKPDNEFI